MQTIAITCQPFFGHFNPLFAIGTELAERGYRVLVLNVADLEGRVRQAGFDFQQIGAEEFPTGAVSAMQRSFQHVTAAQSLRLSMKWMVRYARALIRDAPPILRREQVHGIVGDMAECGTPTVAEAVGLPYTTVSVTIPFNELGMPIVISTWQPWWRLPGRVRDGALNTLADRAFDLRVGRALNRERRRIGLQARRGYAANWSTSLAVVSQCPDALDFPRRIPATHHSVGPLRAGAELSPPFPFEKLDGRPLVYASLGTLQGYRRELFAAIAEACAPLDVQLVITHGNQLSEEQTRGFAGDPLVVPFAPQRALLRRASLAITNCTLNTVLDALAEGVPLVGLPLSFEQPGIAARVAYHRVGELVAPQRASVEQLRAAISRVLKQPHFRAAAAGMRGAIESAGGVEHAASIIERALLTGLPIAPLSATHRPHSAAAIRGENDIVASAAQPNA